jgi:transposase-like protein
MLARAENQDSCTGKHGRTSDGRQRYRCLTLTCRKITVEARERVLPGIKVPDERALMVLQLLCEGVSVRAVERLTGTEKRTILRLLVLAGDACERMLAEQVRGVEVNDVECDEIWGYVHCKEATKKRKGIQNPEAGDTYTFTAIDRESKLLLAFQTGRRNTYEAHDFMAKLATATAGDPGREIIDLAKDRSASLIVIGGHHEGFFRRTFAMSIQDEVKKHADCEVIVVE